MVDTIRSLCAKNGTNIKQLERTLGFSNGSIARWDKNSPSVDKVQRVADYFCVPISTILGDQGPEDGDDALKFALFGDHDVDDALFAEVKRFAKYAQEQAKKEEKP